MSPLKKMNKKAMAESSSHSLGPHLHSKLLTENTIACFFLELSGGGLVVYSLNM